MTKRRPFQQVLNQYIGFGFDPNLIKIAWDKLKGNQNTLMDQIISLSNQNNSLTDQTKITSNMDEDQILGKAIQESLDLAKDKKISFEPLNPEQRLRKSGTPVGLKNIGNTCYFNSILQTYFFNSNFVKQVLGFIEPQIYKKTTKADIQNNPQLKRQIKSIELVKNLQILFAGMIASDKKYLDPTAVITSIVDDYGNELPIGDQKDIGQFNLFFLSRVEQGISLQDRYGKMQIEYNQGSPSKIGILGEAKSQESLLRRSSIKVKQQSTIGKQFFGKIQTTFINLKQGIKKVEQQMFTLLFVNVKHKQLYRAFEQIIISTIDDYKNQKGETVTVEKQCWVKEPPKTLFFQIQRVVYDKQFQTLKKIHQNFDFPRIFYIDPFLQKNKEKSLQIRQEVNKLRLQKQKYQEALRKLQNYNNTNASLSVILQQTINFLSAQSNSMQIENFSELDNPTLFLKNKLNMKSENIQYFRKVKRQSEQRIQNFKNKIKQYQFKIQQSYKKINSTPYYLQSILIHQGQADSGHYYSYTYDQQYKVWRKYNDLIVSQQNQQKVFKDAKGNHLTSAYYLVYAKLEQSSKISEEISNRSYKLSNQPTYGTDIYSQYIPKEVFSIISAQNMQLYTDIQHFKANGYVSKVLDNYVKRFQSCNQLYRKLKVTQKKKNSPPVLINLPIFIKAITNNDQQYKSSLMDASIVNYGPKQDIIVFEDVLKAKLVNLSDFKKPKKIHLDKKYFDDFLMNYKNALIVKYIYSSLKTSNWIEMIAGFAQLRNHINKVNVNSDYFIWLNNLLTKLVLFHLLIETQRTIQQKNYQISIQNLKILNGFYFAHDQLVQQTYIISNIFYWISQLLGEFPQKYHDQINQIVGSISQKKKIHKYLDRILVQSQILNKILQNIDINAEMFNFSKQEDTIINQMLKSQQQLNQKMKISNDILKQIKKTNLPLKKQQRDKIIRQK